MDDATDAAYDGRRCYYASGVTGRVGHGRHGVPTDNVLLRDGASQRGHGEMGENVAVTGHGRTPDGTVMLSSMDPSGWRRDAHGADNGLTEAMVTTTWRSKSMTMAPYMVTM